MLRALLPFWFRVFLLIGASCYFSEANIPGLTLPPCILANTGTNTTSPPQNTTSHQKVTFPKTPFFHPHPFPQRTLSTYTNCRATKSKKQETQSKKKKKKKEEKIYLKHRATKREKQERLKILTIANHNTNHSTPITSFKKETIPPRKYNL
jgi:hypothetical protein